VVTRDTGNDYSLRSTCFFMWRPTSDENRAYKAVVCGRVAAIVSCLQNSQKFQWFASCSSENTKSRVL